VIAGDATSSDMLATALSVLNSDQGARVIAHYRGAAALVGDRSAHGDRWTQTREWSVLTGRK
jgi:thiamine biosynthesis lipoprotein ApbE